MKIRQMCNSQRRILIISFSNIQSDPRVSRQVCFLKDAYELCTIGFGDSPKGVAWHFPVTRKPGRKFSRLNTVLMLKSGLFEKFYWYDLNEWNLKGLIDGCESELRTFELVLANDLDSLPLALRLANGKPVLFDAHEFSPREFEDIFLWRLLYMPYRKYLCRKYLPKAAAMTTVCDGISEEYHRLYGVSPEVITNAVSFSDCSPSPVSEGRMRLIHHGAAIPSRKLEDMFAVMESLDERYTLDLMLVPGEPRYIERLKKIAAGNKRIAFVPPVPMNDIAKTINKYDIGLFCLPPTNFNYKHALPNKFFEFIQARLCIAIGPSPEMAAIVKKYDLGVVADSFDPRAMAAKLNALTKEKIEYYKNQSHKYARELSADENKKKLLKIVADLL
jgi:glycosyltransferase involved in cell wall biosynthesis